MEMQKDLYGKICKLCRFLSTLASDVNHSVEKASKENDLRSGKITLTTLELKLDEMGSGMFKEMEAKLKSVEGIRCVGRSEGESSHKCIHTIYTCQT